MSHSPQRKRLVQLSHLRKKEARLMIGRWLSGPVADHLCWASDHLPVELFWEKEGHEETEFYVDQDGYFEGKIRLFRGSDKNGELVWSGPRFQLIDAINAQVERLRPPPSRKKQLATRVRELQSKTQAALADLRHPWNPSPHKAGQTLESIVAELDAVASELDKADTSA